MHIISVVKETMLVWQKLSGMGKAEFLRVALMLGATQLANGVQDLKAVSQNLMHSNLSITDGIYGVLSEQDLRKQIASLGKKIANEESLDLSDQVRAFEASVNQLNK